ncbi:MAG: PocR ligand-binding domain-containing protein [Oscillospiraceae bacterium]|nr:PocR ligand-binding domain-containing protein [Oscillospiraceae bacterium]MDY6207432.1 PocR ligand-binding domain-containing protein [Oscillospiraceae bacterium]
MKYMGEELHLTDLIPVETLQKIQDSFSKMARMAALTTDENGIPITEGSNFSEFCTNYCRKSPVGRARCEKCDRDGAIMALESSKPVSYFCHAHLVDFAAPVMLGDCMIGSFIGGQVLSEEPDYEKMREIAKEIGVDEEGFLEAARKTQIVPKAAIERSTQFIYEFAGVISDMAYKSYETIKLSRQAMQAAAQKSDFLANMSHEIRTPMNAVLGMAEMALREEMTPQAKQYVRQIRSSGKNLLVIINDILDFSKIESGKMNIVEVVYEPLSIVNDLANIVNTRIGSKDMEFTVDFDPKLPHKLYGDNIRIQQILLNLLNNAVKFTEHGEVHMSISFSQIDSDNIMLKTVIRDTGIGIKKQDIGKLFRSFQQVDSKRNRNIEGTGLGLAISQQLLKLMNGNITVESEYEKGSTFYVELPQKIINSAPSIPCPDNSVKAALIIENEYVYAQVCKDLDTLGIKYINLEYQGSLESIKDGYIIVEKHLFSDRIKKSVMDNPELKCLLLAPYDSPNDVNQPRVKMLHKPIYSLGLYSALGLGDDILPDSGSENDNFPFTAPDAHILIVDDNPINLTVACGIIEPLGMQVDTANGASETIEKVKKIKYDIVFMDHMMPGVDGVETTHIIRRLIVGYENVPIIALTANAIGGTKEMFIQEGMNDFVAKPIEVSDIVAMIRKWLPKEKIIPAVSEKSQPQPAEKTTGSLVIEGLNTKQAISLLGSEKLYMQILREYYLSIDKRAAIITEALEKSNIKGYTIEVHSLKSTSKQIGADALAELAARLEKAGNELDVDLILAKTSDLIAHYLRYKDILAPLFPELSGKTQVLAADRSVVSMLLDSMTEALETMDTLAMDEVLEKMSEYSFTSAQTQCFEKLRAFAEAGDIDMCSAVIGIWRQIAASEGKKNISDTDEVRAVLSKMQSALDDFDSLLIDEAVEQMGNMHFSDAHTELFLKLKKAAEDSDIELCCKIVDEWTNTLR